MKILLAIDDSAYSTAAVDEVGKRLFPPGTEVRIITVVDTRAWASSPGIWGAVDVPYDMTDNSKFSQNLLNNAVKNLSENNPLVIVTTKLMEGSPKTAILEEAELWNADLIIVGSHGYGAIDRFLLGSVSHAVSLHAKCSVEIFRIKNKVNK